MLRSFKALVFVLILSAAKADASSVTVGNFDSGNCYPFSCFASEGGTTFQQVYDASQFSGVSSITELSFFRWSGGRMDTADYQISFSSTSAAVNGLDPFWANNIGSDSEVFGNFTVSGEMPAVLSFTGTPFTYDPTAGNLLMTVMVSNLTSSAIYESFFHADYTGIATSRLWAFGNSAFGTTGNGALVTQFTLSSSSPNPVPEPASMAIFGIGAFGIAAFARRRKKLAV